MSIFTLQSLCRPVANRALYPQNTLHKFETQAARHNKRAYSGLVVMQQELCQYSHCRVCADQWLLQIVVLISKPEVKAWKSALSLSKKLGQILCSRYCAQDIVLKPILLRISGFTLSRSCRDNNLAQIGSVLWPFSSVTFVLGQKL